MREWFRRFSRNTASAVGTPIAFLLALLSIVLWVATGPLFHYSDTWQLVINTATTIVTFLMVFLIQNSQNRDSLAFHIKLNELLRAGKGARNSLINLEEVSDEEIEALHHEFEQMQKHLCRHLEDRKALRKKDRVAVDRPKKAAKKKS